MRRPRNNPRDANVVDLMARRAGAQPRPKRPLPTGPWLPWLILLAAAVLWALLRSRGVLD